MLLLRCAQLGQLDILIMLKLIAMVAALVVAVSAKPYSVSNHIDVELNKEWDAFKVAHAKNYKAQEEIMRYI